MSRTIRKARRARLDEDGTAKPLTEIKVRVYTSPSGKVYPGAHQEYIIRDIDPHNSED